MRSHVDLYNYLQKKLGFNIKFQFLFTKIMVRAILSRGAATRPGSAPCGPTPV